MLSRLGNLCIVIGDGVGDWNEEWLGGGGGTATSSAEYSWLVSVAAISVTWSFEDDAGAAGMKKFAFAGIGGLADFAGGDWNIVLEFPPPGLKRSTYLPQKKVKTIQL